MGENRRKGRELAKQETRQALIAAGIELFTESGIEQPSLDAICKQAGFTRGAFYVHFKDRTDFVIAVLDDALRAFIDSVISEQGPGDLDTTIGLFLDAATALRAPPGQARGPLSLVMHAMQQVPEVRERYATVLSATLRRLADVAESDRRAGIVRVDVAPEQIALILVASAIGVGSLLEVGIDVKLPALHEAAMRIVRSSSST